MEIILFIVGVVAVITFIVWLTSPGNVDGPKALRAFVIFSLTYWLAKYMMVPMIAMTNNTARVIFTQLNGRSPCTSPVRALTRN